MAAAPYALIFIAGVDQTAIVPLLPALQPRFGLSESALPWILTLPSLATLLTSSSLGVLVDRMTPRRVSAAAGITIALATLGQGVPSLPVLIVARIAFGLGNAAVWTAGVAWLAESRPTAPSKGMAATMTASAAGYLIGPATAGVLASHFGLGLPFAVVGTATAGIAASVALSRPAPRLNTHRSIGRTCRPGRHASQLPAGARRIELLRQPEVVAGAVGLAFANSVSLLFQLLVPIQLNSSGHSAEEIGLVLSAGSLAYIAISALFVPMGPRIATLRANAWLTVLLALTMLPAVGSATGLLVAALLLNVLPRAALGTIAFPLATSDQETADRGCGTVIGLVNTVATVPAVLVPTAASAVSALDGPGWAYAGTATVVAGAGALLLRRSELLGRGVLVQQ